MSEYVQVPVDDFELVMSALRAIRDLQPELLEKLRRNNVVFTDIGNDPSNWQHVANTIYSYVVQADTIAGAALNEIGAG